MNCFKFRSWQDCQSKIQEPTKLLETYKVWFETLAALLLSVMAISVSCSQRNIASEQMRLAEIESRPRLLFSFLKFEDNTFIRQDRNASRGGWIEYHIKIENIGKSSALNFKFDSAIIDVQEFQSCSDVVFSDLHPKDRPFPSIIEPEEVYTMPILFSEKNAEGEFINQLPFNKPIGIKFLSEYEPEFSEKTKKSLAVFYVVTNNDVKLLCREEK